MRIGTVQQVSEERRLGGVSEPDVPEYLVDDRAVGDERDYQHLGVAPGARARSSSLSLKFVQSLEARQSVNKPAHCKFQIEYFYNNRVIIFLPFEMRFDHLNQTFPVVERS